MQTREPKKRVNWIFVIILIVAIPLILLVLFMMNSLPNETKPTMSNPKDSVTISAPNPDSTADSINIQNNN